MHTSPSFFRGQQPDDALYEKMQLKPATFRELCDMYGVKYKAMRKMLQPYEHLTGKPTGRYYTVKQLQTIIDKLGPPFMMIEGNQF